VNTPTNTKNSHLTCARPQQRQLPINEGRLPSGPNPVSLAPSPAGTWPPAPLPVAHHLTLDTPGYALGGHGRRAEVPFFEYER
jgi:hypothetical protein